jgi:tripartite-type tricarboxylate transporter receptor subunit TctC
MGPIKMPKEAVTVLNKAVTTVLNGDTGKLLRDRGYEPVPTTPAEFDKFTRQEIARWSKAVKEYNIQPDF